MIELNEETEEIDEENNLTDEQIQLNKKFIELLKVKEIKNNLEFNPNQTSFKGKGLILFYKNFGYTRKTIKEKIIYDSFPKCAYIICKRNKDYYCFIGFTEVYYYNKESKNMSKLFEINGCSPLMLTSPTANPLIKYVITAPLFLTNLKLDGNALKKAEKAELILNIDIVNLVKAGIVHLKKAINFERNRRFIVNMEAYQVKQ